MTNTAISAKNKKLLTQLLSKARNTKDFTMNICHSADTDGKQLKSDIRNIAMIKRVNS